MLSRRAALRALLATTTSAGVTAAMSSRLLAALGAALGAGACDRGEGSSASASARPAPSAPAGPRSVVHEGVDCIELYTRGADETAPLVVAIHGRGDRPENWVDDWQAFPARARILLPRAFTRFSGGFSWFDLHPAMSDTELGANVAEAEARLWRGVAHASQGRKLLVTGFSQGGILSFAMASRHPTEVAYAFPVAGACPGPLLPKSRAAPVYAIHGDADRVLDVKGSRGAVDAFRAQGNEAVLKEYPGVGHAITRAMHADLWAAIQRELPRAI